MDDEMLNRLTPILVKHNPQTKIGAAIVLIELLTAMREPTEKMKLAVNYMDWAVWHQMIDSITGDK